MTTQNTQNCSKPYWSQLEQMQRETKHWHIIIYFGVKTQPIHSRSQPIQRRSVSVIAQCYAWNNIHGLQFLEQQLAGIGHLDGGNVFGGLAEVTPS